MLKSKSVYVNAQTQCPTVHIIEYEEVYSTYLERPRGEKDDVFLLQHIS